jgi:hypothetical protein
MNRQRWIQDRHTGELIPADEYTFKADRGALIMKDIEPFVSPIDQSHINSRSALREHNKKHNVTNSSDFTQQWKRQAEERNARINGTFDPTPIRDSLIRAFEQHRR